MMARDEAVRALAASIVPASSDGVFAVSGLPEETVATLFACASRTDQDFRTMLETLLGSGDLAIAAPVPPGRPDGGEKARAFRETWLRGYGHASVGEHALVHLVLEDISIVAARAVADLRLGSFTERSTLHCRLAPDAALVPPELEGEFADRYATSCRKLHDAHAALLPDVIARLRPRAPSGAGSDEELRVQALELLRGLLPAGTRTSLGLTANARALEILLGKMFANPLAEVRSLATRMHAAAVSVAPTLLAGVAANPYRQALPAAVDQAIRRVYTPPREGASATSVMGQPVRLVRYDRDALERIVLALAYEGSESAVHAAGLIDAVKHAAPRELEEIARAAVASRGPRDPVPRAFEVSTLTFELLLDYGAYRDLGRHRMLTPATQLLTCRLGWETPTEINELGLTDPMQEAMLAAHEGWLELFPHNALAAQYAVPLAYRLRTLWTLNLRELFHVIELRSAQPGHASFRRIAQGLYRVSCSVLPWLKDLVRVDMSH